MRKSNAQLQRDVLDELQWDPDVEPATVGIAVSEGVVLVFGELASFPARSAALRAIERVPGVRAVADEITVHIPGSLRRTDFDIAGDVARLLARDGDVPDTVTARVERGWLWLEGTAEWPFQAAASEAAIRANEPVIGLRGITNDIRIARPAALPAALRTPRCAVVGRGHAG